MDAQEGFLGRGKGNRPSSPGASGGDCKRSRPCGLNGTASGIVTMWIMALLVWSTFAGYGCWIANIKRRRPGEGIALGLLFGPIGCIVEASLRERTAEEI